MRCGVAYYLLLINELTNALALGHRGPGVRSRPGPATAYWVLTTHWVATLGLVSKLFW